MTGALIALRRPAGSFRRRYIPVALLLLSSAIADPATAQQATLGVDASATAGPYRFQIGRRVTYVCPAGAASTDVAVWGTDVYTYDSAVCLAAIHAGVLDPQKGGAVTFTLGPGAPSFEGSVRNGVTSGSYGPYDAAFTFDRTGVPGRIDGMTTLRVPAGFTSPITVVCPPLGTFVQPLWGTDFYADDSSICAAAAHVGLITLDGGGPVNVVPGGPQTSFKGSVRFGVTSQMYGPWPTSFTVVAASSSQGGSLATGAGGVSAGKGITGLVAEPDAQSKIRVHWDALTGATYYATRWKVGDNACCNAQSPPGAALTSPAWQDMVLPSNGTYRYRVLAVTANGMFAAETGIVWPPPAPPPPPKPAATGVPKTGGTPVTDAGPISSSANRPALTKMANAPAPTVTVASTSLLNVSVSWTAPTGAVSYGLSRRDGGQLITDVTNGRVTQTIWKDAFTNPSLTYEYQVIAYQADGSFGVSSWTPFTPPPLTNPTGFSARQSANGQATLEWQPVADAVQYRIDGATIPNTGRLVSGTSALVTPLATGTYSWQIAAVFPGNLMNMTARPTASTAITLTRPPFLSMNNGPGTVGEATYHMANGFKPDCTLSTLRACVRMLDIVGDFNLNDDSWKMLGVSGGGDGAQLYNAKFADMRSLAAGRSVYCAQKGAGLTLTTLCWAATHGPMPGEAGYGDASATLAALGHYPNRGITLIRQTFDGLRFAAFEATDMGGGGAYATDNWGDPKTSTVLDSEGPKFLPHSCLACHGGQHDSSTGRVIGASLLPIDPSQLVFASAADRASQEESLRNINQMVLNSNPSEAIKNYVRAMYGGNLDVAGTKANDQFVPPGWTEAPELWRRVVKPYCASCHAAQTERNDFATYQNMVGLKERVKGIVCTSRSMPHSEPAFNAFWGDGEPGSLADFLVSSIGMGSCAP